MAARFGKAIRADVERPTRPNAICFRASDDELRDLETRAASETPAVTVSEFVRRVLFSVPVRREGVPPHHLPAARVFSKSKPKRASRR